MPSRLGRHAHPGAAPRVESASLGTQRSATLSRDRPSLGRRKRVVRRAVGPLRVPRVPLRERILSSQRSPDSSSWPVEPDPLSGRIHGALGPGLPAPRRAGDEGHGDQHLPGLLRWHDRAAARHLRRVGRHGLHGELRFLADAGVAQPGEMVRPGFGGNHRPRPQPSQRGGVGALERDAGRTAVPPRGRHAAAGPVPRRQPDGLPVQRALGQRLSDRQPLEPRFFVLGDPAPRPAQLPRCPALGRDDSLAPQPGHAGGAHAPLGVRDGQRDPSAALCAALRTTRRRARRRRPLLSRQARQVPGRLEAFALGRVLGPAGGLLRGERPHDGRPAPHRRERDPARTRTSWATSSARLSTRISTGAAC